MPTLRPPLFALIVPKSASVFERMMFVFSVTPPLPVPLTLEFVVLPKELAAPVQPVLSNVRAK